MPTTRRRIGRQRVASSHAGPILAYMRGEIGRDEVRAQVNKFMFFVSPGSPSLINAAMREVWARHGADLLRGQAKPLPERLAFFVRHFGRPNAD